MSATSIAVPSRQKRIGLTRQMNRHAGVSGGPDELVAVSIPATIGTKSCPACVDRESNEAPANSTSGPMSRPPIPAAASDVRILSERRRYRGPMADDPHARIHLVVLFGGESAEHDVSCTTAAHVLRAADRHRSRITPVGISTEGQWALAEHAAAALLIGPDSIPGRLDPTSTNVSATPMLAAAADADEITVVLPLLHGPLGEDGTVQGMLDLANVPYVGSGVLGSAVSMDKAMAKQVLAAARIPQARYRAFAEHEMTPELPAQLVDELGLPLFVKPANMGSSVGVSKASNHRVAPARRSTMPSPTTR